MAMTITSANKGAFPDVQRFEPDTVIPEALVLSTSTVGAVIEGDAPSVRVPFVVEDPEAGFVPEGEDINEVEPKLSELVVNTDKIAVIHAVSREAYTYNGIGAMLTDSLKRAVVNKADAAYLTNPSAPTGLVNIPGVIAGDNITDNLDPLIDAIAAIENNNGMPTHILASPAAWAYIQKIKMGAGFNTPIVGNVTDATEPRLAGLPVVVNSHVPANQLLVIDRTQIISAVGPVDAAVSDQAAFIRDGVVIRVTMRFGFGVLHPNRLAMLAVGKAQNKATLPSADLEPSESLTPSTGTSAGEKK